MRFTIYDTGAAAETVAVRWTMTGTHDVPRVGMESTGETVEFDAIEINRFKDGKRRETWTQSDQLGLMQQVGAIPSEQTSTILYMYGGMVGECGCHDEMSISCVFV
jgi:hypothetical protein